jgi:hypothetical protein
VRRDLIPPRAPWHKHLRPLRYAWNRILDNCPTRVPDSLARLFRGDATLPGASYAAMWASVVPGCGHLLDGRRAPGILAFFVWAALVAWVAVFYASTTGTILFSLLWSWHANVVFDSGRIRALVDSARDRLRIMLAVILVVFLAYLAIDLTIRRHWLFIRAPYDHPTIGLHLGDTLLFQRTRPGELPRYGDLVTIEPDRQIRVVRTGNGPNVVFRFRGDTPLSVLALPGDRVEVAPTELRVNGVRVPLSRLPAGYLPLPPTSVTLTLRAGQFFGVTPLQRSRRLEFDLNAEQVWNDFFLFGIGEIRGRATWLWQPFWRRHRL